MPASKLLYIVTTSKSSQEIDELYDERVLESLIPSITVAEPHTIINGKEVVNFASANYLRFVGHDKLLESCNFALEKYGVSSCGLCGFYGIIDVHLDCEYRITKFLGTHDSILYSYGLSTLFSAIPCFRKKDGIIVVDKGVHWGIQNGRYLSRSTIVYFKHNDMESLERTLEKITAQNSGQIAPLDKIIKLKEKYRFRVLLDETNSLGVLGRTARGLTEYCGVPIEKIDIVTAAMGHALATEGGFCTGSARVIDHQLFLATSSPHLYAITAIDILEQNPDLTSKLKENIAILCKRLVSSLIFSFLYGLSDIRVLSIASNPESPIFLVLEKSTGSVKSDIQLLEDMPIALKQESIFVVALKRSTLDKCPLHVGIRLFVSAAHSESDLLKACESLKRVAAAMLR
ncbi:hypothetical protein PVK06_000913 [Gossypium arboreum]|uniref:serine C-palmitoyltransferase n=1 Tax=Gossypium arboreum TaxID=29729 RepID=A0ABR0R0U0_GOSAR|nr:hypothetical protein PVK06_000913 [Gossypium arboreum]